MTVTFPLLDRARRVQGLVTGEEKAAALARLVAGDRSIPAGRVAAVRAAVFADRAAAAQLPDDKRGWRG
jgi:6-phosphogluconolactonase